MAEPSLEFGALIGLITLGSGAPDSLHGELVVRTESAEGGTEVRLQVWRAGRLSRREMLDGAVLEIEGHSTVWTRYPEESELTAVPRRVTFLGQGITPIGALEVGGPRPTFTRWDGTDFTRPTGPVTASKFLGRPAWTVHLVPPPDRLPLELVVDAQTGVLLRLAEQTWSVEWGRLDVGVELEAELFVWTGPSHPPRRPRADLDHERQLAQRREWLARHGITDGEISVSPQLMLHAWDEATGELHIGYDAQVEGSVLRRPRAGTRWGDADRMTWPHVYRWSDDRWDWFLGCNVEFSEDQLTAWRVRSAGTT